MVKCIAPFGAFRCTGKIGGIVYQTGNFGQYARAHRLQTRKPTDKQKLQNYLFGLVSDEWRSLSDEDKLTWDNKAKGKKMSGYNLYIKENIKSSGIYGVSKYGNSIYQ